MLNIEGSLDAFFNSNSNVLVIKGEWGVGKTFFWNNYFDKHKNSLSQIAYSYISLFGKDSLNDLRKDIFHLAKPIKKLNEISSFLINRSNEVNEIYSCIPWNNPQKSIINKIPILKKIIKYADNVPLLSNTSRMLSNFEYSLVDNYLICFDDLERKGDNLTIKEIMGLIDELAQLKNCKVVLIFNEETLPTENEKLTFQLYREKVVDLEIRYAPTIKQNFDCVYYKKDKNYKQLLEIFTILNIKNIRFFNKVRELMNSFYNDLKDADDEVRKEFVLHACILCWGYYLSQKDLPYDELRQRMTRDSFISSFYGSEDKSLAGEAFKELSSKIHIFTSPFDDDIDFFLRNGYQYPDSRINDFIKEKNNNEYKKRLNRKIRQIWNIYHDSFSNNEKDFLNSIFDILNTEIENISLGDFDSMISILKDFDVKVENYINDYIKLSSLEYNENENNSVHFNLAMRDVKNKDLREKLINKFENNKKVNLNQVVSRLASSNGWNPDDVSYLNSLSTQDFVNWIKERESDVANDIRRGLLKFKDYNDKPAYIEITDKVTHALKIIAAENKLNYLRVKSMFNIDIAATDKTNQEK
ncbi:P-loop NTPase fold protein [Pragia fontium]|uniref:P-loop NTPase fold protein n=1 Tax=Pragia fontium TaxID=82985 RepID=UPI000F6DB38D|nr:P-loop NTPase fold protein [Pragia fontium]VEJ55679.1 KAP family P-loop domain [Pragia fontium]